MRINNGKCCLGRSQETVKFMLQFDWFDLECTSKNSMWS